MVGHLLVIRRRIVAIEVSSFMDICVDKEEYERYGMIANFKIVDEKYKR